MAARSGRLARDGPAELPLRRLRHGAGAASRPRPSSCRRVDGSRIASFGGGGARTPLWLADRLSVVRTPRTLLAVAAPSRAATRAGRPERCARSRGCCRSGRGKLLVEVPDSQDQLDAALLSQPDEYDNIAAVTTTADGSLAPDAPVRVFVNPQVFERLKARGAQVVMSHETTHVATGATFASMPTWLLEGFADYVALDHAGVPVAPRGRPDPRADPQEGGACRPAHERRPRPDRQRARRDLRGSLAGLSLPGPGVRRPRAGALLRHGRAGSSTQDAFRSVLHTSQSAFVTRWRDDLRQLAGVAG